MSKPFIIDHRLDLAALETLSQKPPLFEGGTVEFWKDPHIAQQMLKLHLDPATEAASRPPDEIDRTSAWIIEQLGLQPGDALLDLGCGPGLYCQRFAARGLHVTGVDFSQNSITYAREHDPTVRYLCQNYLTLDFDKQFNAATMIFGDFCVLSDAARTKLLDNVRRALLPGGQFVFDVSTYALHEKLQSAKTSWYVSGEGGFWKPGAHLVLQQNFWYPEADTVLEQYAVIEGDGALTVYRNWFHYYSPETITPVLEAAGFTVTAITGDLTGAPYSPDAEWTGVVARRG